MMIHLRESRAISHLYLEMKSAVKAAGRVVFMRHGCVAFVT